MLGQAGIYLFMRHIIQARMVCIIHIYIVYEIFILCAHNAHGLLVLPASHFSHHLLRASSTVSNVSVLFTLVYFTSARDHFWSFIFSDNRSFIFNWLLFVCSFFELYKYIKFSWAHKWRTGYDFFPHFVMVLLIFVSFCYV